MTITWGGAIRTNDTSTASATKTVVLASDVPAGASIIVGLLNRTDLTTTLSSVSDPVNGAWPSAGLIQGPVDGGPRGWLMALNNSAALSGAGNRTVSVTTSAGISTQLVALWASSDLGALTTQDIATAFTSAVNVTSYPSGSVDLTNSGAVVGFLYCSNSQGSTAPTVDTGEVLRTTVADAGAFRSNLITEDVASAGSYSLLATFGTTTAGCFLAFALQEAGGSPAPSITNVDGDNSVTAIQTGAVVNGTNFDTATLTFTQGLIDVAQDITAQDATTITFNVVFDAGAGPHLFFGSATATVENTDTQFDTQAITIAVPAGSAFVDLVDPLVSSGLRLTGIPDLAGGDQIWYYGVEGGGTISDVTVLANGSISIVPGTVTGFWARAFDPSTDTWGAPAFQDLAAAGDGGLGGSEIGQSDLSLGSGISGSNLNVDNMFYS